MKNLLLSLLMLGVFLVSAQDRPKNMGNSDFDNFKNSSFDIRDESATLKENVTQLDNEVKGYKSVINTVEIGKLKSNIKALRESKEAIKVLNERIGVLDEQGKTMVNEAKNVTPKMKSVSATKNTNASVKALGAAKEDLGAVTAILDEDIKLIIDELTARGESEE